MQTILLAIVAGIIIGPLARLALPGKQNISLIMTVILGAVGALAGSAIFRALSDRSDTSGIDWIAFFIGVVVAAAAILVYTTMTSRRGRTIA
ncbi:MAG: GlsB/YeaQ/YmgE family stress response membrane protein [Dermatophilaceae bacterium]